jgi:acyl-CoA thioester hydrolase
MISKKEIEVRYNETDQMGIVYHANYVIWCELGRTQFLADAGFAYYELEDRNLLFPIREVHLEYLKPCKFGENITVHTQVKEFNSIKTTYYHEIKCGDELRVKGTTTVVCVNKDTFRLTKIDKHAPDVYKAYQKILASK